MPGAAQWWCHVPVVAEGGLSRGCSRKDADALFSGGEAWYVAAVSATDLVPKGVTFKPISHYNLRAKRRAWPETGVTEGKQTELRWTIAVSLSGCETSALHRERGAGEPGLCFPWGTEQAAAGLRLPWHHCSAVQHAGGLSAIRRLSKWYYKPKAPHFTACVKQVQTWDSGETELKPKTTKSS